MAAGLEGAEIKFSYEVVRILEKLKENRTKHKNDYDEAMIGYRTERTEALIEAVAKLRKNTTEMLKAQDDGEDYTLDDLLDDVDLRLDKPLEFLQQYDDFIEQLEWTEQKTFELSRVMFKQLVQDDWSWTHRFKQSNSKYIAVVGR